jgi:catechol 2,3-dioxygenase
VRVHLGANTWESAGAGQPPAGSAALKQVTIVLPSEADRDRLKAEVADAAYEIEPVDEGMLVRDPSGNRVLLARPLLPSASSVIG